MGQPQEKLNPVRSAQQAKRSIKKLAWALFRLPYSIPHGIYHRLIPYRIRIIFWAYRRRHLRSIKEYAQARNRAFIKQAQSELKQIIAEHSDTKGVIVFAPSIEWNVPLFQRPHQMALAFASLGYLVFFWVPVDSIDNVTSFRKVRDGLYLCNVPPSVLRIIKSPIAITYTYNYNWAAQLTSPLIIYELIDHLEIFTNFPLPLLRHYHKRLLSRAAIVAGTADELFEDVARHRPDAILCPNGVDIEHFAAYTGDTPEDIQRVAAEGKPIIGYYGALAEWFDYDLMMYAARALPEYNFVLIGPDHDFSLSESGITQLANVHWLGAKDYRMLPGYLQAFTVATIPFKVTKALQAVSPIKLFEYMAGGRPVVTTDLVECRKYPVVLISRNQNEFVEHLRQAVQLRNDEAYLAALISTAQANTWRTRARTILTEVEAQQAPLLPSLSISEEKTDANSP